MSEKNKKLCETLMLIDSAIEIKTVLTKSGYWNDEKSWRPFSDTENNFGSIGNQQSDPVAALVEKLINSIDARLMGLAAINNITPESEDCPKDMRQAIAHFVEQKRAPFGERDGNIFYWDEEKIKKESGNISLFATGKRAKEGNPCLTISDNGEGQTPDCFPSTFMSLGKNNKMYIPFVQGKFNMGGTGVFQFCKGEDNSQIQMVLSRRNQNLLQKNASLRDKEWGFSIIRRVTRTGMRNPMYEYLAPIDGEVLSFDAEEMPIFPSDDKDRPRAYSKKSQWGTMIKLFEYDSQYAKTNLTFAGSKGTSLKMRIEEALTESALPIQIAECRPHLEGRERRSFVDEILGSITQLGNMDAERRLKRLDTPTPISGAVTLGGSVLPVKVYVFAEDAESTRYNPKGIFYSINGQTHGTAPTNFFTRKKVNYSYIKDSMFVVIDCTHMEPDTRADLFMNSRDRLRKGQSAQELEDQLEAFLGEEPTLQQLNRKRQQDRIKRSLDDQRPLEDTLRRLVKTNPRLAELLPLGIRIPTASIGMGSGHGAGSVFEGKKNPSFFRFKKNRNLIEREHPINQAIRLEFETDALDSYFSRKSTPGTLLIECLDSQGKEVPLNYRIGNLHSGVLAITLLLNPREVSVNDSFTYNFITTDDSQVKPFENTFKVKILEPALPGVAGTNGTDSTGTKEKGNEGGTKSAGLPNIMPVTKEQWDAEGFNELTALQIKSNPDSGYDFFYNKDNRDLIFSQNLGKIDPKVLDHQYKIGLMLIGLSLVDSSKKKTEDESPRIISGDTDIEGLVAEVTQAISPFWLSIIEALGGLKLEENLSLE